MLSIKELHEKILYPCVRIRAKKAAGSGTIIYSGPIPENGDGDYETYILTNHHVIADLIDVKKQFDPLVKKKIDREFLAQAEVSVFEYVWQSHVDSAKTYRADIIAYDENHDLALLRLDSPLPADYTAALYRKGHERNIKLFEPVWCAGCSLAHDPICNAGVITYLEERIDNKLYWMSNANSIFGNSGGAMYLAESGEFIGVPSRVTGLQLGFGVDIITWMGFFIPAPRIYEFFDEQLLYFLYDSEYTSKQCFEMREKKKKEALLAMRYKEEESDE